MIWWSLLLACGPRVVCGPGTYESEGICLPGIPEGDGELDVYVLAGQSNMDGVSPVTGLPPSLRVAQQDALLYWSGSGALGPLAPASSRGPGYTGPEVTFGRTLADAGEEVVIVKHAVSGTSLASYWNPGDSSRSTDAGRGWLDLVATMRATEDELDATGQPWRWAGFVWMQGETDADDEGMSSAYESNLEALFARVREETDTPDLPVVMGLIAEEPWPYAPVVRDAQEAVAQGDPSVVAVDTSDLDRNVYDKIHLDGPSMRVLGERFANVFLGFAPAPAPTAAITLVSRRFQASGNRTAGWRFQTDRTLLITDVGAFSSDYPKISQEWGIWDETTGALLARGAVPNWFEAPTTGRGGFWYAAVEPFELPAGDYLIATAGWSDVGNDLAYDGIGTVGTGVTFVEGRYVDGYWLALPTEVAPQAGGLGLLGPSFLYLQP